MKKLSVVIAAVVVLVFVGLVGYRAHVVGGLQRQVTDVLLDPGSAQFRAVRFSSDWTVAGGVMCGEVNTRNPFGGYIGYQKFVVLGSREPVLGDEELVGAMCGALDGPQPWWYLRGG